MSARRLTRQQENEHEEDYDYEVARAHARQRHAALAHQRGPARRRRRQRRRLGRRFRLRRRHDDASASAPDSAGPARVTRSTWARRSTCGRRAAFLDGAARMTMPLSNVIAAPAREDTLAPALSRAWTP